MSTEKINDNPPTPAPLPECNFILLVHAITNLETLAILLISYFLELFVQGPWIIFLLWVEHAWFNQCVTNSMLDNATGQTAIVWICNTIIHPRVPELLATDSHILYQIPYIY